MVVGARGEVDALCREIRARGDGPDFIAVDGKEGRPLAEVFPYPPMRVEPSTRTTAPNEHPLTAIA